MRVFGALLVCLAIGCSADPPPSMIVYVEPANQTIISAFVDELPVDGVRVVTADDPASAFQMSDAPQIAVVADLDSCECYRIERTGEGAIVHGDAPLGIQYGLAELLEAMGFRFFHPQRALVPEVLALPESVSGELHEPELALRAIHLHTLHPIEAYWAFWEPSPEHFAEARRIIDWVVKNRGNFVQWWALANIESDEGERAAWRDHTRAIIEYAHLRGVGVGLAVQLFGRGNIQQGFSLDGDAPDASARIREHLAIFDGLGLDKIKISFGEFAAEDPDLFISTLNDATAAIHEMSPDTEVTASVHVGDDLRVTYMGMEQLYYFLVRYADPSIVPWVHSVMYYNLYDDAGGAYHHEDFSEHRAFLLERLANDQRAVYFPENAYWVAFDNSVPMYLPVYLRSRWLDQSRLREDSGGALREHAVFSSGWEWGYWQQDYFVLRSNYHLSDRWEDDVHAMLAPFGARGDTVADAITALAELQHQHLIVGRLAAYLAGRDSILDLGRPMGIVSQPDRPTFEEIAAMDATSLDAFETSVVVPLGAFADGTEPLLAAVEPAVESDRWLAEISDGIAVDLHRARFAHAVWAAVVLHARGGDATALLAQARIELDAAYLVVQRRHADLHDPDPHRVIAARISNATLYQYGYLREADRLCYWERELAQATNVITGGSDRLPGCVL